MSAVNSEAGIRIDFANGRNWNAFGDLTAPPIALDSGYLSGITTQVSAAFALLPNVEFELLSGAVSHAGQPRFVMHFGTQMPDYYVHHRLILEALCCMFLR